MCAYCVFSPTVFSTTPIITETALRGFGVLSLREALGLTPRSKHVRQYSSRRMTSRRLYAVYLQLGKIGKEAGRYAQRRYVVRQRIEHARKQWYWRRRQSDRCGLCLMTNGKWRCPVVPSRANEIEDSLSEQNLRTRYGMPCLKVLTGSICGGLVGHATHSVFWQRGIGTWT